MEELFECCANYVPLSPTSFIERASMVYGDEVSIIYGTIKFTWRETHERCRKLASSLCHHLDISPGDIVATLAPNVPALYELHFAVPMAGAVLSALNPKLDATTLASLLQQLNPKIIFVDYQFIEHVLKSFEILSDTPFVVLIQELDPTIDTTRSINITLPDSMDYNALIAMGKLDFDPRIPKNECDPISISYTSGSTGTPKGAVYSHRAAHLNSLAQVFRCHMREKPVFLWTVDMFRCNGWCFTWAMAALGGTNICLRQNNLTGKTMLDAIGIHNVTHLCGAPILLTMISECYRFRLIPNPVQIIVAGSLPPTETLTKIINFGFNITHAYGMTEALGPVIYKSWFPNNTSVTDKESRVIHDYIEADVKDPGTLKSVPWDGTTIGELMFKGNTMMTCYFKNAKATQEAFRGGWFRTGDYGVRHHDGNVRMMDRKKDAIIDRNGAIISSIDVERALVSHPRVLEAAVVGRGDDSLGEVVCAFVKLREGDGLCCEEIIEFCEGILPSYMVPRSVVFGDLPFNSTGKVQKFVLRERIKVM